MEHALFSCQNVKHLPISILTCIKIQNLTQLPVSAPKLILYDPYSSLKTLINSIWLLFVCFVFSNRLNKVPNSAKSISRKIKEIIISTNRAYPKRNLARECRKLQLNDFLASHEIGLRPHWSTFETI